MLYYHHEAGTKPRQEIKSLLIGVRKMKRLTVCFRFNGKSFATNSGSRTMPDALQSKSFAKLARIEGFEPFVTTSEKAKALTECNCFKKRGGWDMQVLEAVLEGAI